MDVPAIQSNPLFGDYARSQSARTEPSPTPLAAPAPVRLSELGQVQAALAQVGELARDTRDAIVAAVPEAAAANQASPQQASAPPAVAPVQAFVTADASQRPAAPETGRRGLSLLEARSAAAANEEADTVRRREQLELAELLRIQRERGSSAVAAPVAVVAEANVNPFALLTAPVPGDGFSVPPLGASAAMAREDSAAAPVRLTPASAARLVEGVDVLVTAVAALEARLANLAQAEPAQAPRAEAVRTALRAAIEDGLREASAPRTQPAVLKRAEGGALRVDAAALQQAFERAPVETARVFVNRGAGFAERLAGLAGSEPAAARVEPDLAALAQAYRQTLPAPVAAASSSPNAERRDSRPAAASASSPHDATVLENQLGGNSGLVNRLKLIANLMTP